MTTQLIPKVFAFDTAAAGGTLVSDARFGKVTSLLAKQAFKVTPFTGNEVCLSVWVKRQRINDDVQLHTNGATWHIADTGLVSFDNQETSTVIPHNQWHQLTLVQTRLAAKLYVNGVLAHHIDKDYPVLAGTLSYSSESGNVLLSQQHSYDYGLDASAVQASYVSGLPTVKKTFTQAQPISFALVHPQKGLYKGQANNALLIVDAVGNSKVTQQLVIKNESQTTILLQANSEREATPDAHHLELRFRHGVFENVPTQLNIANKTGWRISAPQQNPSDGSWSIYLLSNSSVALKAGETLVFDFSYRTVNNALQERPAPFSLSYQQMAFDGGQSIRGDRNVSMSIANLSSNNALLTELNQRIADANDVVNNMEKATEKEITDLKSALERAGDTLLTDAGSANAGSLGEKLVAAFQQVKTHLASLDDEIDSRASADQLGDLKRGAPLQAYAHSAYGMVINHPNCDFEVRLANTSGQELAFPSKGTVRVRFTLGTQSRDLVQSLDQIGGCTPALGFTESGSKNRTFTFQTTNTKIAKNGDLVFLFNDFTPNSVAGQSLLEVEVEGLEGYPTQYLFAILPKVDDVTVNGMMVKGDVSVTKGVSIEETLRAQNLYLAGSRADLTWKEGEQLQIGTVTPPASGAISEQHGFSEKMRITHQGNVGIGNSSPRDKLEVTGSIRADRLISLNDASYVVDASGNSTLNHVTMNGNVGIGDASPSDRLEVAGNIRADKLIDRNNTSYVVDASGSSTLNHVTMNGNVGIGDASPSDRLEVAGNIRAEKFVDRNDTSYYLDPSNISQVKDLTAKGYLRGNGYYITNLNASNISSGTLNRSRLPNIRLVWGDAQNTGYVNSWDSHFYYYFGTGKVMVGLESYHDNHKEDRRFCLWYRTLKLEIS